MRNNFFKEFNNNYKIKDENVVNENISSKKLLLAVILLFLNNFGNILFFFSLKERVKLFSLRFFFLDNVNEYLKLAANADKQQLQRIKAVFEKKNQKSAISISQLQKKLESYNKRLRDLETHGLSSSHRQPREMLRDMGQGLK